MHQRGWDAPGFSPAAPWAPATAATPVVQQVSVAGAPIRVMANVTPASVTAHNSSKMDVSGGLFVKSDSSPDVWWVKTNSGIKNFLTVCTPCDGLDACSMLNDVTQAYIDSLAQGVNFTCALLPSVNVSTFVFDVSRNMAGFCSLRTPAAPVGTVLTLAHGEILSTTGDVKNTFGSSAPPRTCSPGGLNCADQMDQFVFGADSAAGGEVFTPTFTFHGFRYVALFGWPSSSPPPDVTSLTCHQVHSDVARAGSVTFNSSTLNAIQAAIVQTQVSNIFSIPSDCPTREKRGWMGDAQGSSSQALCNLRIGQIFYENWARSFSDSVFMSCAHASGADLAVDGAPPRPADYKCCDAYPNDAMFGCQKGLTPTNATGSLPDVVPFDSISGWPGDWVWQGMYKTPPAHPPPPPTDHCPYPASFATRAPYPLPCTVAGEVIPHGSLLAEGNVAALELLWPYVTAHMAFAAEAASPLLLFGPYNDWLAAEPVSMHFAENFYLVYAAQLAAEMAAALGRPQEAAAYVALADAKAAAMVSALFDTSQGRWDGSGNMNAQSMALAVSLGGAATSGYSAQITAAMVADVAAHTNHPTGGKLPRQNSAKHSPNHPPTHPLANIPGQPRPARPHPNTRTGVTSIRWILAGLTAANRTDVALAMALVPTSPSWAYMSTPDMPGTIWES